MCSNFWQRNFERLAAELGARPAAFFLSYVPPYESVFPGNIVAAVGRKANSTERGMFPLHWGLLPNWAPGRDHKPRPLLARAETVDRYGVFRESFRTRRCLIPVDAFLEWSRAKPKRRFRFEPAGDSVLGFAGLWDVWGTGVDRVYSCAFITCVSGPVLGAINDRQPVLLRRETWEAWLDPQTPLEELKAVLQQSKSQEITASPDDLSRRPDAK